MSCVSVLFAPGFEEVEAITIVDVLRRAEIETQMIGVEGREVAGSHGIRVHTDLGLEDAESKKWDWVVLPGGMPGSATLRDNPRVQAFLKKHAAGGGSFGAICAAPIALSQAGLLEGRRATSYPGFREELRCGSYSVDPVVLDDKVMTSRGPGTAFAFALRLVEVIKSSLASEKVAKSMLISSR